MSWFTSKYREVGWVTARPTTTTVSSGAGAMPASTPPPETTTASSAVAIWPLFDGGDAAELWPSGPGEEEDDVDYDEEGLTEVEAWLVGTATLLAATVLLLGFALLWRWATGRDL